MPHRRQVLCGLLGALIAPGALVAGCADAGSEKAAAGPAVGELAKLAEVPEGGGMLVSGPNGSTLLLLRPSADTVKGVDARCTHQGPLVDPPRDGRIVCPMHGSVFDATDGTVLRGPARRPLKEVPVRVEDGKVFLA
ncbi:Rieske (2Fe-2S) protein [Actinokineospora sp. HBU206404]|uniref:Cytochrome bc1 complex Rieske iron-sulfur subunit n=1 Tax=Actinokineospora xionganensis TaxID=2684470 RepID=A0ABR7KZY4_9PSEU|nr:Rieske (2Fe-2S) protein [Actinokineospora xionganensis]